MSMSGHDRASAIAMQSVLVVDDEPQIAQIARDYLERAGFSVLLAADGVTALRLTRHDSTAGTFRAGDLAIDQSRMRVDRDGAAIDLTTTEFQLLAALARHPGRVFTRAQLLDSVRGTEVDAFERAIDTHVKN